MQELKPPSAIPTRFSNLSVFLAGSIEQGRAVEWQSALVKTFKDEKITFLNPRRDHWDPSWRQDINEEQFRTQVEWELDALERADLIIMYLQPETMSPVTLLELGLFAKSGKVIVCCPDGFWRKGNVDIVCHRFGVPQVEKISDLENIIRERLKSS